MPSRTTEEQLVYGFAFESLFTGLGPRFTPALREKVRALGLEVEKLGPAYPKGLWVRVIDTVVDELKTGELATARRQLGRDLTEGFARSTLGKVLTPAVRLVGVKRALMRLPWHLAVSNNFVRASVVETGPSSLQVEVNEAVPSPEFLCGVIEGIASYAGAESCDVRLSSETVFTVSWS